MPAERSPKGKTPSKGKAATRPRQHLKDNVDPCGICGVVVSRKSDIPRHAKTHASEAEKLPCPWEGCMFRTLQKSNLDTHYRRHTQDRSYNCTDDPDCKFQTCDPASLLRHRKRLHGYTPRASVGYKDEKPYKHVPVRIIRGIESDSRSVASQFSTFSSAASTSGSTSSAPTSRSSPPDSLSPSPSPSSSLSPSPPSPSSSRSCLRSFPPANSSGESGVSSPSTPIASISDRELTPEISSPTILSMTSSPVYPTGKSLLFSDDSLLHPHTKNYAWGLFDLPLTSSPVSPRSEHLEFQCLEEETNDQSMSVLDELDFLRLPPQLPDMEKVWPGYETAGQLNGSEGLDKEHHQQQPYEAAKAQEINSQVTFGVSINGSPFLQSHNLPISLFQSSSSDFYDSNCTKVGISSPALTMDPPLVLDPLGLEIGFECGGSLTSVGSGHGQISSTVEANPASAIIHYHDVATRTTFVDDGTASLDSIAGDQRRHQTITDANTNTKPNNSTTTIDINVDYELNTSSGNVSSVVIPSHLNVAQWDILLGLYGLEYDEFVDLSQHASVVIDDVDADAESDMHHSFS